MTGNESDPRLRMVEFIVTLGGLLGIITSLLQDLLVPEARTAFVTFIVLFIVFAFLAYATVATTSPRRTIQFALAGFSATFSGLLVVSFSIPLSNASLGIALLSEKYIGVYPAITIYILLLFGLVYLIYRLMTRAIMRAFGRMAP